MTISRGRWRYDRTNFAFAAEGGRRSVISFQAGFCPTGRSVNIMRRPSQHAAPPPKPWLTKPRLRTVTPPSTFDQGSVRNRRVDRRCDGTGIGDHHRLKSWRSTAHEPRLPPAKLVPPIEQLLRPQTMTPRDVRDHDAVLAALRDNRPFLFVRPLPTSLHAPENSIRRIGVALLSTLRSTLELKTIAAHRQGSCPRSLQI